MAGGPSTAEHPKSSSAARKSRWASPSSAAATATATTNSQPQPQSQQSRPNSNPNPTTRPKSSPKPAPSPKPTPPVGPPHNHRPPPPPPPQPTYGFHMLERRTITLADGSVRSYHALPPDYQDFPLQIPPPRLLPPLGPVPLPLPLPGPSRQQDYWNSLGLDSGKRKFDDGEESSRATKQKRPPGAVVINGCGGGGGGGDRREPSAKVVATKHSEVDQGELKKAFLKFVKIVNDPAGQRRSLLENGRLHCPACPLPASGRYTKDFLDTHSLVMHCYSSENANFLIDHLGLHKALCALMKWNYSMPPDSSKAYQYLPADEAASIQGDLILWHPIVIIHNTLTGKNQEGRMEGLGNKYMDNRIKDLGFTGGKSKSLYGREGHLGTTIIKFSGDHKGLKEAIRLAEFFERNNHGRKGWARLQPLTLGGPEDENNPLIMNLEEKSRDKKRIFYGYLGTASDLDKIDFETRKKIGIENLREYKPSQ